MILKNDAEHIPIFLCSNNKFAPCISTVITSICTNSKCFFDFYVIESGISSFNKFRIDTLKKFYKNFSIEFIKIDLNKYFINFKETARITKDMFSRLLIPELKPEINKAIYIDVDIIVMNDISKLYYENLENYAVGAVWEIHAENDINTERKKRLNIPLAHKYFSSGTLLIDCKQWRTHLIKEKLFDMEKEIHNVLSCPDMDLLNKFFQNNYKILPVKYSWINQNFEYFGYNTNYIIRHFNGPLKPWLLKPQKENISKPYSINCKEFWKYAKLTPFYLDFKILYYKNVLKNKFQKYSNYFFNYLGCE